jgi:hypothetical protein
MGLGISLRSILRNTPFKKFYLCLQKILALRETCIVDDASLYSIQLRMIEFLQRYLPQLNQKNRA